MDARSTLRDCPDSHGQLLVVDGRLYCPHQAHDGRPRTHKDGYAPRTPAYFPWPDR